MEDQREHASESELEKERHNKRRARLERAIINIFIVKKEKASAALHVIERTGKKGSLRRQLSAAATGA